MKKLFTVFFGLSCIWTARSQTLTFQHEGKDIENGATVYSRKMDEMLDLPEFFRETRFIPEITLTSTTDAENVHITLVSTDGVSKMELCSFDGQCTASVNSEKKGPMKAGEPIDAQIHYSESGIGKIVTKSAEVSAWYDGKESEKISFTLVMTNDETVAVRDVRSTGTVAVNGETLTWSFDNAAARTLEVYTVGGAKAMTCALDGNAGSVSLSSLPSGVYVYRINGDARPVEGKFMVK